jgi:hypothetical protein
MKIHIETKLTSVAIAVVCVALLAPFSRWAAATITAASAADSGPSLLGAALASAAGGDTINFAVNGGIGLTSGELLVTKSLKIVGPDPRQLGLYGDCSDRVFRIGSNAVVGVSGLTIAGGSFKLEAGGGIYNDGDVGSASLTVINRAVSTNKTNITNRAP